MQHPVMSAGIGGLAFAQAFREVRPLQRAESAERVSPRTPTPATGVVGRLAGRLVPELALAVPRGALR